MYIYIYDKTCTSFGLYQDLREKKNNHGDRDA